MRQVQRTSRTLQMIEDAGFAVKTNGEGDRTTKRKRKEKRRRTAQGTESPATTDGIECLVSSSRWAITVLEKTKDT